MKRKIVDDALRAALRDEIGRLPLVRPSEEAISRATEQGTERASDQAPRRTPSRTRRRVQTDRLAFLPVAAVGLLFLTAGLSNGLSAAGLGSPRDDSLAAGLDLSLPKDPEAAFASFLRGVRLDS